LLLFAAPVVFLCVVEGTLRLAGFGRSDAFFIPDERVGYYRTNPYFTAPFIPASFGIAPLNFRIRKHKEPNTVRVFVLGESAAQGMPEPGLGFAAQLRVQLRARFPGKTLEVFNLGITAINSHVVYQIARQVTPFEPDIFVVYMGNNEVVGPYGPGCAYMSANPPLWLIRASVRVRGTRLGQLLLRAISSISPSREKSQEWKGMETFSQDSVRGDDPKLEAVYRNFSANLQDIVDAAGKAGIKTVLATVVANLKDSAPFISMNRPGLTAAETKSWHEAFEAGVVASDLGDSESALYDFTESLRIDPQYAEAHFRVAKLEEALGDRASSRRQYLEALHWDALRFRPDKRINDIVRQVARGAEGTVLLVDAAKAMGSDPGSPGPLSGHEILFDHVHFNWAGNFRVAQLLADGCAKELSERDQPPGDRIDAAGCAAALGYTPDAELRMLKVLVQLTLKPPFTSQFTFTEDQARYKKEVELANAQLITPESRAAVLGVVRAALERDQENASLAMRLGAMETDAGNLDRALSLYERAETLLPRSSDMAWRKAEVLIRMRRYDEAESLLFGSLEMDEDYFSAGGELVELWAANRQLDKGKRFFDGELARFPKNPYLRLEYASLLALMGEWGGSEREARRIIDDDPGSRTAAAAIELLVRIFGQMRRPEAADALALEAREHQAHDYFNNQRLVAIYSATGDAAKTADSLLALEASGPFDAAQHFELAHRLADLNRGREMLDELSHAREVAQIEGNEEQTTRIKDLIAIYRKRFSEKQPP
jgi:tetratricopeptide (TPR) repeat protein